MNIFYFFRWIVLLLLITNLNCQQNKKYVQYFNTVWNTINENFYDPLFGGIDWDQVYEKYKPIISNVHSDDDFYEQINRMLFELNVSHTGLIPSGYWPLVEPTTFAKGSIGLDVRITNNSAIITEVKKDSPADLAGIKPSYILLSINGKRIEEMAEDRLKFLEPPFNKNYSITAEVQSYIFGSIGSTVELKYLDNKGTEHTKLIERVQRKNIVDPDNSFPEYVIEFESRIINNNIGYIKFNWFFPSISSYIQETLHKFNVTKGLIIDLRGNPGGLHDETIRVAENFFEKGELACIEEIRNGTRKIYLNPASAPYSKKIIIIVDIMTKSSSEWFAGCLQTMDRGIIIGEKTSGSVGPANLIVLPDGASLIYPYARTVLTNGNVLEGNGVIPDIEINLEEDYLLESLDLPLEKAVTLLNTNEDI